MYVIPYIQEHQVGVAAATVVIRKLGDQNPSVTYTLQDQK